MSPEHGETSEDAILGGRLVLRQPLRGHRVGHDAILLAAATAAQSGDHRCDLLTQTREIGAEDRRGNADAHSRTGSGDGEGGGALTPATAPRGRFRSRSWITTTRRCWARCPTT